MTVGIGATVYRYTTAQPGGRYLIAGGMILSGAALLFTSLGDLWAK